MIAVISAISVFVLKQVQRRRQELLSLKRDTYVFPLEFRGKPMFFKCIVGFTGFQKKRLLTIPLRNLDGYAFYNYDGEKLSIDTTVTGGAVYIFVVDTLHFNTEKYILVTDSIFSLENPTWKGKHVLIVRKRSVDLYMTHYTNEELKKLWRM